MILETLVLGSMEVNCYILAENEGGRAIIIDPGAEERKIRKVLDKYRLAPAFIINTHGHYDHIGCDDKFAVPVYVHSKDSVFLKDPMLNMSGLFALSYKVKTEIRILEDRDKLELDGIELRVMHVPGHTPGGIVLVMTKPQNKIAFTGDSLFCRGIGRSDLPKGDGAMLEKYIKERLFSLSDDTVIYPGHGPSSTIGEEKRGNPFMV